MIAISTVNVRFVVLLLLSWSSVSLSTATLNLEDQLRTLTQNYVNSISFFISFFPFKLIGFFYELQMQFKESVETNFEAKFHQVEDKNRQLEEKVIRLESKVQRLELVIALRENTVASKRVDPLTGRSSIPRTCREARLADPSLNSGMHWIDPDGQGVGDDPIYVHCDMTTGITDTGKM
jgi:hypothetical protein